MCSLKFPQIRNKKCILQSSFFPYHEKMTIYFVEDLTHAIFMKVQIILTCSF